jgi:peptidoglycan/LPS O-acetylase OafA/YrhL
MPDIEAARGNRLPLLDGIRALAIAFVLTGHSILSWLGNPGSLLGLFGVSIFFTLSGYLITRSMLLDESVHGHLRLRNFYFRRALRIFPAFYAFLITLFLLSRLGIMPSTDLKTWLAAAAYFRNFTGRGWETLHLWSLALEEQFYFFWPLLFILTRRRRLGFIASAVVAFAVWRSIWIWSHHGLPPVISDPGGLYWRPDLRLDTFLIGGAFAIGDWKWPRTAPVHIVAALLIVWCPLAIKTTVLLPFDTAVTAFGMATMIAWLVANPNSAAGRLLSHPAPVFVGILSYSIYLWQELFLGPHARWWSLPAVALVSFASYGLIERPFLRLRERGRTMRGNSAVPDHVGISRLARESQ